ncbi:hypothetical protein PIB30_073701 [Stylosanthes scabra]|uniref:Uncharacterized protein n=1 Tax=Stylosanthes scabra TaxID=79078 RepID=A0ABU6YNE2_9FABA|nr:hypothetical protein [Stylosanthes scabra]
MAAEATVGLSNGLSRNMMISTLGNSSFSHSDTHPSSDEPPSQPPRSQSQPQPQTQPPSQPHPWFPPRIGTKRITEFFKSQYKSFIPKFSMVPRHVRDLWWQEFKRCFRFHPGQEHDMYIAWCIRAAKRLRDMFCAIRTKGAPTDWIPEDIFLQLKECWSTKEYRNTRSKSQQSRASARGGSLHTGGSITQTATEKKMENELGRPPSRIEIFERTHTNKKDRGKWVDHRSKETRDLYEKNLSKAEEDRASQIASGATDVPPISEDVIWSVTVGGQKRGTLYGVGLVNSQRMPSSYVTGMSEERSTASAPDHIEYVNLLKRELAEQWTRHAELEARYLAEHVGFHAIYTKRLLEWCTATSTTFLLESNRAYSAKKYSDTRWR